MLTSQPRFAISAYCGATRELMNATYEMPPDIYTGLITSSSAEGILSMGYTAVISQESTGRKGCSHETSKISIGAFPGNLRSVRRHDVCPNRYFLTTYYKPAHTVQSAQRSLNDAFELHSTNCISHKTWRLRALLPLPSYLTNKSLELSYVRYALDYDTNSPALLLILSFSPKIFARNFPGQLQSLHSHTHNACCPSNCSTGVTSHVYMLKKREIVAMSTASALSCLQIRGSEHPGHVKCRSGHQGRQGLSSKGAKVRYHIGACCAPKCIIMVTFSGEKNRQIC